MLKKVLTISLIVALVFSLTACGGGNEPAAGGDEEAVKPKTLKMNITISETSSWYQGAKKYKDLIEERTNGRYIIDIYPNEQLSGGNQTKGIENVQTGVTDVDIHSTIIYTVVDERFTAVNMPWMIPTYEEADAAIEGHGGELIFEIARENGVVPLALGESGYRQITNNVRPIEKPSDLQNMKIRVPGIKMFLDLFDLLGADPTSMNFAGVFTALQQGTIDGQENPVDIISSSKLDEVQEYLTLTNYVYDALLLSVSTNLWDTLSEEDKIIFEEAGIEAMAYQKEVARISNEEKIAELNTTMQVNELTPEQIDVFQEAMVPLYEHWEEILGLELMEAFGYQKQ